jgi:hypothetical protein
VRPRGRLRLRRLTIRWRWRRCNICLWERNKIGSRRCSRKRWNKNNYKRYKRKNNKSST